jgi:hypothetical protein
MTPPRPPWPMRSRGALDAVSGVVGDAATALRRRRIGRRPYAKLYDEAGGVRTLDAEDEQAQALHDAAEAMVDAVAPTPRGGSSEAA